MTEVGSYDNIGKILHGIKKYNAQLIEAHKYHQEYNYNTLDIISKN